MIDDDKLGAPTARTRVLVVDDDPRLARCLKRGLIRDHDVVVETDSRCALTRIERGERYNAIVTDLAMPKISGVELYSEIRALDAAQAEKIIFVTAGASDERTQMFLDSISNPQLVKPVELSTLRDAVMQLISSKTFTPNLSTENAMLATFAKRFDLKALDHDPSCAALVGPDGSILWVNSSWRSFGAENGANPTAIAPGQNYFHAISGSLKVWFSELFASCFASGEAVDADYECSSPNTKRFFHMQLLPVSNAGLLIRHTLRIERSQEHGLEPDVRNYAGDEGIIVMCSNCRHVRRVDHKTWDWVPGWLVKAPALVSHGLCDVCHAYYYRT
jgi:CheY-like chemotaxis protein